MKYKTVVIDYGHGENTPGKRYTFTDHDNFECREYITNRMTAQRLIKLLINAGHSVYDCVADRFWQSHHVNCNSWSWESLHQREVSLSTRVRRANAIPDNFLISLHSNAIGYSNTGPSLNARGGVMYTSPGQTNSDKIAESLYESFTAAFENEPVHMRRGDMSDGDHDNEAKFYMLTKTRGPAVLGEMLFFVNIQDARYLMSEHGQDVIAQGYFDGIKDYLI